MTISVTTTKAQYSGNGVTDAFSTGFQFADNSWVKVTVYSSAGVPSVKTISTHYTVTGAGTGSAGTVTFTSGNIPTSGQVILIELNVPFTQTLDLTNGSNLPNENLESALNKLTQMAQTLQAQVDRILKINGLDAISNLEMPPLSLNEGKLLQINAAGDGYEAVSLSTLSDATVVVDTDGTLASNSDSKVPSQKATKTYADAQLASVGDVRVLASGTLTGVTSSAPSAAIELTSGYNYYELYIYATQTVSGSRHVGLQFGTDSATFATGSGDYDSSASTAESYARITTSFGTGGASEVLHSRIRIYDPRSSTKLTMIYSENGASTTSAFSATPSTAVGASRLSAEANTHLRFITSTTDATQIVYTLYGFK